MFGKHKVPLHGARIEEYAVIGDCETAALVSRDGSIDWLCWPSFASPACFAALLGTAENGYWRIRPQDEITAVERQYRPDTMILETRFQTATGEVCLTDFMPPRGRHSDVIRIVEGVRGKVRLRMELVLRFDYGLTIPWVTMEGTDFRAVAGPNMVVLRTQCAEGERVKIRGEGLRTVAEFPLRAGEKHCFTLTYAGSIEEMPEVVPSEAALADTESFWRTWSSRSQYDGPYGQQVKRSLLTLKALTYRPTGGMVAAVTAGLPEVLGGGRNWDYRYCWLRDTSFTLLAMVRAGYTEEAVEWRKWLLRAVAGAPDQVQTLYGIGGERQILEWTVGWLPGYEHSKPVRVGNAAATQFQLDVFGEVASALFRTPNAAEDLKAPAADLQSALIDHLCKIWDQPDDGIWETRGGRKHFVHSKVMAWVGLDRAIRNTQRFDGGGDVKRWKRNRDKLHKEILKQGFNNKLNSFTQSYGSKALDASCLRLGLVGFLPMNDPRIVGTIDAIQKNLTTPDGLVRRYDSSASPDGLKGNEGVFLACSFWLVICLHLIGRQDEAHTLFDRLISLENDVGLLSEEWSPKDRRMLGNFPQALSHIGLIHAALTLSGQWTPELAASGG